MTVNHEEHKFLRDLPIKPYQGCQHLQKEKDRKLRAALVAALSEETNVRDIGHMADLVMRVLKEQR